MAPHPQARVPLSREDIAKIEIGHTTVAPATVRLLVLFFLGTIGILPLADIPAFVDAVGSGRRAAARAGDPDGLAAPGASGPWSRLVAANRRRLAGLGAFERGLEDGSRIGRSLRPQAQLVLTRWLGAGNERVYPGLAAWLFYRPEVEYLTGPGFLDPRQVRRRIASAAEWTSPPQPDPRGALVQFNRDLAARGITLVVMPTPVKPGVHPEHLVRRYDSTTTLLQNPSYATLLDDLDRQGVIVFDPADTLAAARFAAPQYLSSDTHWRPETMEAVVEGLASVIETRVPLPSAADPGHRLERVEVKNVGDIARMLDLPDDARLGFTEAVWVRRVLLADGSPWRSTREADVLLLGDSFSNIYTLESMGWGTSAGLAEQLSYTLRRPVDRIVQNDEGAFATRALLAQEPERLTGKRVVVYQFSARELAFGDWRVIALSK